MVNLLPSVVSDYFWPPKIPPPDVSKTFIPPPVPQGSSTKPQRNVIFLFDGTGDKVDADETNVVQFCNMLYNHPDPDDKNGFAALPNPASKEANQRQVVYYRRGIGTWRPPGKRSLIPFYGVVSQTYDKAVANNFPDHVMDAYKALSAEYVEGDKICLFGFSRGSYTARAVAAVIGYFGILPKDAQTDANFDRVEEIYFKPTKDGFIKDKSTPEFHASVKEFCEKHHPKMVTIEFVGVWDTVSSVGVITETGTMYTSSNPHLKTFRHAIALDERRARFDRSMWRTRVGYETDVDQVWFAGAHCDIGGGSVENGTKPNLANIPFRWMIRECFKTDTGIIFAADNLLKDIGLDPSSLYPIVKPRPEALSLREDSIVRTTESTSKLKDQKISETATEEEHDLVDALAPIYDMLAIKWYMWNPLELIPVKKWSPIRGDTNEPNRWAGRKIDAIPKDQEKPQKWGAMILDNTIKIHRTVRMRMLAKSEDPKGAYVPAATLETGGNTRKISVDDEAIVWVD